MDPFSSVSIEDQLELLGISSPLRSTPRYYDGEDDDGDDDRVYQDSSFSSGLPVRSHSSDNDNDDNDSDPLSNSAFLASAELSHRARLAQDQAADDDMFAHLHHNNNHSSPRFPSSALAASPPFVSTPTAFPSPQHSSSSAGAAVAGAVSAAAAASVATDAAALAVWSRDWATVCPALALAPAIYSKPYSKSRGAETDSCSNNSDNVMAAAVGDGSLDDSSVAGIAIAAAAAAAPPALTPPISAQHVLAYLTTLSSSGSSSSSATKAGNGSASVAKSGALAGYRALLSPAALAAAFVYLVTVARAVDEGLLAVAALALVVNFAVPAALSVAMGEDAGLMQSAVTTVVGNITNNINSNGNRAHGKTKSKSKSVRGSGPSHNDESESESDTALMINSDGHQSSGNVGNAASAITAGGLTSSWLTVSAVTREASALATGVYRQLSAFAASAAAVADAESAADSAAAPHNPLANEVSNSLSAAAAATAVSAAATATTTNNSNSSSSVSASASSASSATAAATALASGVGAGSNAVLPTFEWAKTLPAAPATAAAARAAAAAAAAAAAGAAATAAAGGPSVAAAGLLLPLAADVVLGRMPLTVADAGDREQQQQESKRSGCEHVSEHDRYLQQQQQQQQKQLRSSAVKGNAFIVVLKSNLTSIGHMYRWFVFFCVVCRSTPLIPPSYRFLPTLASLNPDNNYSTHASAEADANAGAGRKLSRPVWTALSVVFPLFCLYITALMRIFAPFFMILVNWPSYAFLPSLTNSIGDPGSSASASSTTPALMPLFSVADYLPKAVTEALTSLVPPLHLRPLTLYYTLKTLALLALTVPSAVVVCRYFSRKYDVNDADGAAPALGSLGSTLTALTLSKPTATTANNNNNGGSGSGDGVTVNAAVVSPVRLPPRPAPPSRLMLCFVGFINVLVLTLADLAALRSIAVVVMAGLVAVAAHDDVKRRGKRGGGGVGAQRHYY